MSGVSTVSASEKEMDALGRQFVAMQMVFKRPAEGDIINRRYRVVKQIGEGGMGVVYLTEDTRLKRPVAIKIVNMEVLAPKGEAYTREYLWRFDREAKAAARLTHPDVVTIHDMDATEDGTYFLVLEYVEGERHLGDLIRESEGHVPAVEMVRLMVRILGALRDIHEADIIHRDLKPQNILITGRDKRPKICDLGVAKLVSDDLAHDETGMTKAGTLMGTYRYSSPEQLHVIEHPVDARSDLYSIGAIMYQMLSGSVPFSGNLAEVVKAHLDRKSRAVPLRDLLPGSVSEELSAVVMKALEPDPADRYQSAEELCEALLEARLTVTKPSSGLGVFAAIAVAALLAFGGFAWHKDWFSQIQARRAVNQAVDKAVGGIESLVARPQASKPAELEELKAIPAPVVEAKPTLPLGVLQKLFDDGKYREAYEAAALYVNRRPESVEGWYVLGMSQTYLEDRAAHSREALDKFVELAPTGDRRVRFVRSLLKK